MRLAGVEEISVAPKQSGGRARGTQGPSRVELSGPKPKQTGRGLEPRSQVQHGGSGLKGPVRAKAEARKAEVRTRKSDWTARFVGTGEVRGHEICL